MERWNGRKKKKNVGWTLFKGRNKRLISGQSATRKCNNVKTLLLLCLFRAAVVKTPIFVFTVK